MTTDDLTILELSEAAERLHCSVYFVRTIIANEELPFIKIGKRFCVTAGDLNRWIERARGHHGEADRPRSKPKAAEKKGRKRGNTPGAGIRTVA
jgi:excisionase family DNA binding protein